MSTSLGRRGRSAVVAGTQACAQAAAMARIGELVETPAFVIDERVIVEAVSRGAELARECGFQLLYALKPLPDASVISLMAPFVDGFAASSVFEARLARMAIGEAGSVHVTSPGICERDVDELGAVCDHVALNSLPQLRRLGRRLTRQGQLGLRVNPQFSLVADERYDPCRRYSKLGVPLDDLRARLARGSGMLEGVEGLLLHSNCDSPDFGPLLSTVLHLEEAVGPWLDRLEWINLGGGYLLEAGADVSSLRQAVSRLRDGHGLTVFMEPGAALVRRAGFMVSEVIDLFRSQGKWVAVLDTSINHFPEAFEYQFEPDVMGHDDDGEHEYLLAGCSCLAGDMLGEYAFDERLRIGSRVVLPELGAYSLVKAHMFNGINLPALYSVGKDGVLTLRRRFDYQDFLSRFGVSRDAAV